MVPTIEPWTKFIDILKGFGDMGEIIAGVAKDMDWERRAELARQLFQACVKANQDKDALVMLKLLDRAVSKDRNAHDILERGRRFQKDLEDIFWGLPDKTTGSAAGGPCACLVTTKVYIVGQLIGEWTATEMPESVHAFRRLIAMGWPGQERQGQRNGESGVEMKARGRLVFNEERKGICDIVRIHMDRFGSYEERKAGPDAVFGPWLTHAHVPEDIRNILVVARAKMGGSDLALRDVRNGAVFQGLPGVALERLQDVVGPVRQIMADCEAIRQQVVAKMRKRNPQWCEDRAPLGWQVTFPQLDLVQIDVGPTADPGQTLVDIGVIVDPKTTRGVRATWRLNVKVIDRPLGHAGDVTATWAMA